MAGTGDIYQSSNFELNSQRPLDARQTQTDSTARDAIALVQRYDGLEIYDETAKTKYTLVLGTVDNDLDNNANWVENAILTPGVTNISNFVNDANYTTGGGTTNISEFINDANYTSSGDNISIFTNDSGYLTSIPASYLQSGDNVSELINDAGYLTGLPSNVMIEGENISLLNNDAGYLTSIPSNVMLEGENISLLTNDAGYITSVPSASTTVPSRDFIFPEGKSTIP